MDIVIVTRIEYSKEGVFGVMTVNDKIVGFTLENKDTLIPEGVYNATRDRTGRHQYFKVNDVPGRSNIEIHAGNIQDDTIGCIILGTYMGRLWDKRAVLRSKDALSVMMDELVDPEAGFRLWVRR